MTRRGTWATRALAAVLVLALAVYAYDVVKNGRARRELEASRARMNDALERVIETRALDLFFAEDAPVFASDLRASFGDGFDFLVARVAWWRWNLGVPVRLPEDPARDERMRGALSRAEVSAPRSPRGSRRSSRLSSTTSTRTRTCTSTATRSAASSKPSRRSRVRAPETRSRRGSGPTGSPLRRGKGGVAMQRPDVRSMHRLPMLEASRSTLEKCVFCPKLCRSACPVSNAEPRETITPWGKMSMAYFAAQGDVPMQPTYAAPAWACTGCYACRESCDHRNDVATTLFTARDGLVRQGVAPRGATRALAKFAAHDHATRMAVRELATHAAVRPDAKTALLIGCVYARATPREARDAITAASALLREPVALVERCCGLPLLHAGDAARFAAHAEGLAADTRGASSILVADAGCAMALRVRYPAAGVTLSAKVELIVEVAARELGRLVPADDAEPSRGARVKSGASVRYHDPCQLGRGLGVYDAPRAVLTRALGRAPEEFDTRREKGACSGAGGLLPATMPDTARAIARARVEEHARDGGGRIVTACGSSLRALRRAAREHPAASAEPAKVDDLVTWIARSTPAWSP